MDDLEVFTDYGKRGSTIAKLKSEIEQLTADRSAFARETKEYRDVWMHDQIKIERLRTALEGLTNAALAGIAPLPSQIQAGFDALKEEK